MRADRHEVRVLAISVASAPPQRQKRRWRLPVWFLLETGQSLPGYLYRRKFRQIWIVASLLPYQPEAPVWATVSRRQVVSIRSEV